jgi:primosomal protein N' (replication factor Y)
MCAIGDVYRSYAKYTIAGKETIISQKTDVLWMKLLDEEYLIYQALQQQSSLKIQDIVLF